MTMRKIISYILIVFLPFLLVLYGILNILIVKDHRVFFNPEYTYKTYSDALVNGNTVIVNESIRPDYYFVKYMLKNGHAYPYVTLSFLPASAVNLSLYDSIKLIVKTGSVSRIRILVKNIDPSFTRPDDFLSHVYFVYELPVSAGKNVYHITYDDLDVPEWWYDKNKISVNELVIDKNLTHVSGIEISTAYSPKLNTKSYIRVNELLFYKSTRGKVMGVFLMLGFFLGYICVLISFKYILNRKKDVNEITVSAHQNLTLPSEGSDAEKVLLYIGNNYTDSDLKVAVVSRECGVPKHLVPLIVSERFNISFRQYLNMIRLTEAKRLLVETGLSTTEISARVGYKNYAHFHRVFKKHKQVSPAQYRVLKEK